jgi:hypothetical protein
MKATSWGFRVEQLLAVDLVVGDVALPFGRDEPVDELLAQLFLYMRVFLRVHQHHAVLVEVALVALDGDDQIALFLNDSQVPRSEST